MELAELGMFLFIAQLGWPFMHEGQTSNRLLRFVANNDKQRSQLQQTE